MQIKDIKLLDESIQVLPKIKRDKDRFIVSLSLDLSEEQLKVLGFKPRTIKRGNDVKKPTLREIVIKGFADINARLDRIENAPTMKRELAEQEKQGNKK